MKTEYRIVEIDEFGETTRTLIYFVSRRMLPEAVQQLIDDGIESNIAIEQWEETEDGFGLVDKDFSYSNFLQ